MNKEFKWGCITLIVCIVILSIVGLVSQRMDEIQDLKIKQLYHYN